MRVWKGGRGKEQACESEQPVKHLLRIHGADKEDTVDGHFEKLADEGTDAAHHVSL